ncbi:MAG: helix-turn-helix transcriptional regulator [Thermoanaerobaculia bacterium]
MSFENSAAGTPPLRGAGADLEARWLYQGSNIRIGRWRCRTVGVSRGAGPGRSLGWPQVAFLDRGVFTLHSGGRTELVDQSGALIHSPPCEFRTSHPFGSGDAGTFFAFPPEGFEELAGSRDSRRAFAGESFRIARGSVTSECYARVRLLVARLNQPGSMDPLEVEEVSTALLATVLSDAPNRVRPLRPRAAALGRRRQIVESAKEKLAAHFRRPPRLDELPEALGISRYHLCRIFRDETGISMHRYVNRLRLRSAFGAAIAGADLEQLALDSGFSSHSHFTAAFRREFGAAPRVVREMFEVSSWRRRAAEI